MATVAAVDQSRLAPTTAPSSTLAIFDLDRTLIPGSSSCMSDASFRAEAS